MHSILIVEDDMNIEGLLKEAPDYIGEYVRSMKNAIR